MSLKQISISAGSTTFRRFSSALWAVVLGTAVGILVFPNIFKTQALAVPATTYVVTKVADTNDGACDADCSLREAVAAANTAPSDDIIQFDASVFASPITITLSLGELTIANNGTLTVNGTGMDLLTLNGNDISRLFNVSTGATAAIIGMSLVNGFNNADEGGGGIINSGLLTITNVAISDCFSAIRGGGIVNNGGLANFSLNAVTVHHNETLLEGGGVYNSSGTMRFNSSILHHNNSIQRGGGIYNHQGTIFFNRSTASDNTVTNGGGIFNSAGAFTAVDSAIDRNLASSLGGGIFNDGLNATGIVLTNVTVSTNTANNGGGMENLNGGTVTLTSTTFSHNRAMTGGFAVGGVRNSGGTLNAKNSIFANSRIFGLASADMSGTLVSQGFNLIEGVGLTTISGVTTGNILPVGLGRTSRTDRLPLIVYPPIFCIGSYAFTAGV